MQRLDVGAPTYTSILHQLHAAYLCTLSLWDACCSPWLSQTNDENFLNLGVLYIVKKMPSIPVLAGLRCGATWCPLESHNCNRDYVKQKRQKPEADDKAS